MPPYAFSRTDMRRPQTFPLTLALATFFSACAGPRDSGSSGAMEVVTDTVGDTIVVRTLSGSAWGRDARLVPEVSIGEMEGALEYIFGNVYSLAVAADGTLYVVDRQVPELRAYSPDGVFLSILGGPGEGPGELKNPDGGLAVLSDGRILVRDPGNARIQVYAPDGEDLDTWPIRGGFNTSQSFHLTRADEVHSLILLDTEADVSEWTFGMVRIGPDGIPGDTLIPPDLGYEAPTLEAREQSGDNNSVSISSVPFSPSEDWAIHPDGYFVHGLSTEYRFTVLRPDQPVRIERTYEAAPVTGGEKAEEEVSMTRSMRFTEPGWRWNGPAMPDVKPPFSDLYAGRDGRIWVQVHQTAVDVGDPLYDPKDPDAVEDRWREPVTFDVFEADGTYAGRVFTPMGFRTHPSPIFGETHVWATTRDDFGVQRVVRFRIELDEPDELP
jgi:hypothetical protein